MPMAVGRAVPVPQRYVRTGMTPADARAAAGGPSSALLAAWLPARRTARVTPKIAMQDD